ncbi:MAG: hypothetical protein N2648_01000 [Aquificaceae bacterium]|nr:hypothetical protein [Aquificaceae bacterium]MCS7196730.1 hypothetical protein [Aquificaceae bacterium]MCX7989206.1 hypothetical protein [Aquificaceae bacterium]MDW8032456.1 hypothetical protein [Aquificaceae bacterium]MDW8294272.1 hypothetical protein [Aquificaceae bacterium]
MKVLLVFYSKLLEDGDLLRKVNEKVNLLKRFIGPDSLYAVITTEMKDFIDRFPDLVFIRNDRGTFLYGLYKGLRKLRGNDVLVLDPLRFTSLDRLKDFISKRRRNALYTSEGQWKGLALFRLVDLDYFIRTLESSFQEERDLFAVVEKVKEDYGIEYETL